MKIITILTSLLIGAISTLILTNNVDFLSSSKGSTVLLKKDLDFMENNEIKLSLPRGTKLIFNSQYDDVGEFYLGVVITDLSLVEHSDGFSKYFQSNELQAKGLESQ